MPFDPLAKPTDDDIAREREALSRQWDGALNSMETAYSFYLRQYPVWDSKDPRQANRPVFRSGKATSIVDHAVDATLVFSPKFHRNPVGDADGSEEAASRVENGLTAVFQDAMLQNPYYAPKVNGKQLAIANYTKLYVGLDSGAISRPMRKRGELKADFDRREWEWESNRHAWNPIRIEVPAPGEVLMNPLEKSPSVAIRHRKMRAYELEDLVANKGKKRGVEVRSLYTVGEGKDPYEEIDLVERWSAHWYALQITGKETLFVEPNSWGFQPFIHTFGGAAVIPIVSRPLSLQAFDPKHYVEQGLLFPIMDDIVLLDQMVIGQHQLLQAAAWARRGYRGEAQEGAQQLEGDVLQGEDDDWWVEKLPQLPNQSFTHEGLLKTDMEESTYSLLEAGFPQSNMDTATHVIILSEKVHRKFQSAVSQINHLYSIAGSNVLKLVHRMKDAYDIDSIEMGRLSLRATDIADRFHIDVDFGQVDTVTYLQQKQSAMQELQADIIDRRTYYSIARYEDVAAIEKGVIRDRVLERPDVNAMLEAQVLREEGFEEIAQRLEEEVALRQAQGAPEGEQPLIPQTQPSNGTSPGGNLIGGT